MAPDAAAQQSDLAPPTFEAESAALLRERFRAGCRIILAGVALFSIADFLITPHLLGPLYLIAATQVAIVVAALGALRRASTHGAVSLVGLATLAGVMGTATVSDVLSHNTQCTTLLAAPLTLLTAVLLPWGWWPQVAAVVIFEAAGAVTAALTFESLVGYGYAAASALILGIASIGLTDVLERSRRTRWQMEESLTRSTRRVEEEAAIAAVLVEVGQVLAANLNRPDMLERVNEIARRAIGCDWSSTFLWDAERKVTRMVASAGVRPEVRAELEQLEFGADRYPVIRAVRPGQLLEISDVATQTFFSPDLMQRLETASALYAPTACGGKIVGTQIHGYRERTGLFTDRQRRLARGIAHATAIAVENARLITDLQAASRLKSEFVATMSHELRTPLNVITGYTEMLAEGAYGQLAPEQDDALARVRRSAMELLDLVSATLDLGRLEAGREEIHRDLVEVDAVFAELAVELAPLRNPAVALDWRGATGLTVLSDRVKLKTIVKNLVGNALKFTPRGAVTVTASWADELLTVEVRDTGVGIKRESLRLIFDMYRQADGSSTRRFGGVGLGLHIVKRLVDVLGGTIRVESDEGGGASFVFQHPASAVRSRATGTG